MIFDPYWEKTKPKYSQRSEATENLKAKWGYEENSANGSLEAARRVLIRKLANPQIWYTFSVSQANYFINILEFEADWKRGIGDWVRSLVPLGDTKKKVDGQAYYNKAKVFLDTILTKSRTGGLTSGIGG